MTGGVVMVQGAAFDLLFTSVIDASKKAAGFTSHLNRLNSTLSSIKPNFDDIEKLNIIMDRPPHETEEFIARLKEAQLLISRCSRVSKWNFLMRLYYSYELSVLEASLRNFFQFNVAALHLCETKRILVFVTNLQETLNQVVEHRMSSNAVVGNEGTVVGENGEISVVVMEG